MTSSSYPVSQNFNPEHLRITVHHYSAGRRFVEHRVIMVVLERAARAQSAASTPHQHHALHYERHVCTLPVLTSTASEDSATEYYWHGEESFCAYCPTLNLRNTSSVCLSNRRMSMTMLTILDFSQGFGIAPPMYKFAHS